MRESSNILVLTYWSLPDALVQTYTLPYLKIIRRQLPPGGSVTLFTLEKDPSLIQGENTWAKTLEQEGIRWMPQPYHPFGVTAIVRFPLIVIRLLSRLRKEKIRYIHCWATPAGAIGYLLSMFTGTTLIIDSYEPHAEAMVENGTWRRNSLAFRVLLYLEKKQTRRAKHLIAANSGMRRYALDTYGVRLNELLVKPACVDLELFDPSSMDAGALRKELGLEGKRVAVYAGKLGGIYLDKEVFQFFKAGFDRWHDQFRVLLLTNQPETEIESYCSSAGIERTGIVTRFVPHREVPRYLAVADFAITPVKPVPTKQFCTPIKDGEYWAMGLPVVIPAGISDDSEIIRRHHIGAVLDRLDADAYAAALDRLESLFAEPKDQLAKRIRQIAVQYRNFSIAEEVYRHVYGN